MGVKQTNVIQTCLMMGINFLNSELKFSVSLWFLKLLEELPKLIENLNHNLTVFTPPLNLSPHCHPPTELYKQHEVPRPRSPESLQQVFSTIIYRCHSGYQQGEHTHTVGVYEIIIPNPTVFTVAYQ